MPDNFYDLLSSVDIFQNKLFRRFFSGLPSECQKTVWIKIRPEILSGLILIQTVCQKTLAGEELKRRVYLQ